MARKDKFKEMQQSGGGVLTSLQTMVNTVAAIEQKTEQAASAPSHNDEQADSIVVQKQQAQQSAAMQEQMFTRLPNPEIPIAEYNLVSQYVSTLRNMTRQDWVELAIVEKLHNDGLMDDETFSARAIAIRNRPPRGQRKGFKAVRNK